MYNKDIKFSLWCDFVERSFLDGEFRELIRNSIINGATSNPAIFKSAFLTSEAYKDEINSLKGKSAKEIYEILAIEDIKQAAERLMPLYEKGDDGFISIEVDPFLYDDANETIKEGRKLFQSIGMPNVMIKIPATDAGYEAMEVLMSEGINVNATLIFSPSQAKECVEALRDGTLTCKDKGIKIPKAVISIFVSRFDRKLDPLLESKGLPVGKTGIYNALAIYNLINEFNTDNIRALFASTGVKGDGFEKDYYIKNLLCYNSVNTAPLDTIKHFVNADESVEETIYDTEKIESFFLELRDNGIEMEDIYDSLMQEGLVSFKNAFKEILDSLRG